MDAAAFLAAFIVASRRGARSADAAAVGLLCSVVGDDDPRASPLLAHLIATRPATVVEMAPSISIHLSGAPVEPPAETDPPEEPAPAVVRPTCAVDPPSQAEPQPASHVSEERPAAPAHRRRHRG